MMLFQGLTDDLDLISTHDVQCPGQVVWSGCLQAFLTLSSSGP